eukprot:4336606-Amphidinium_carterae.1
MFTDLGPYQGQDFAARAVFSAILYFLALRAVGKRPVLIQNYRRATSGFHHATCLLCLPILASCVLIMSYYHVKACSPSLA